MRFWRHIHKWIRTGHFVVPSGYVPRKDVLPAQELYGRKMYWRSCRCGHVEEYLPGPAWSRLP